MQSQLLGDLEFFEVDNVNSTVYLYLLRSNREDYRQKHGVDKPRGKRRKKNANHAAEVALWPKYNAV